VLPLDDEAALRELFAKEGSAIAAVIIEPVPANHGLLLQRHAFLQLLRELTRRHGSLLIFDEVISGFRVARGGAAEHYRITPDLATFGKIVGGGMPVGAFGASKAIMSRLAPDGDTYQAGTLSGNPVAMAAGIATLDILERERAWEQLEARGARLEQLLAPIVGTAPFPLHLVRLGSLLWLSLHDEPTLRRAGTLSAQAAARFRKIFHAMLDRGVYIAPSAYEVIFVSLAHCEDDLQRFAASLSESIRVAAE